MDQQAIRQHGRKSRKILSVGHHEKAAKKLIRHLQNVPEFVEAETVAAYIAMAEEINLQKVIKFCFEANKKVAVPVITDVSNAKMGFVTLTKTTDLAPSELGILEPVAPHVFLDHKAFDVVLTPLVAFDKNCNRVGMGSGYYDGAFQGLDPKSRPFFIGCAFDCQKVSEITPNEWDVPVDIVVTEMDIYRRS